MTLGISDATHVEITAGVEPRRAGGHRPAAVLEDLENGDAVRVASPTRAKGKKAKPDDGDEDEADDKDDEG